MVGDIMCERGRFQWTGPAKIPPFFLAAWQFLFGRRQKEQIPITASQPGGGEASLNATQRAAVASALSWARHGVPPSSVPQKGTFLRVTGTLACAHPRPSHPLRVLKGLSVHGAAHRRFQPRAGRGMMTPPAGISISLNFLGHGRVDKISPRSLFTAFPPQGL